MSEARLLVMAAIASAPAGSEMAGHVRGVFAATCGARRSGSSARMFSVEPERLRTA